MFNLLSLMFYVAACGEECPEAAVQDYSDVEDIPIPSQNREEDSNQDTDSTVEDPTEQIEDDEKEEDQVPEVAPTITYSFTDADSLLYVQVFKDTSAWGSGLSHDHVMRAASFQGSAQYNADDITQCAFSFSVPVAELRVDETAMRQYVGYADSINEGDRSTIRDHMLSSTQLNGTSFPDITFESTGCELDGDNLIISGDMTLRGTTRSLSFDVDLDVNNDEFFMLGSINFNHSDFNMEPYSAFGGFVKNSQPLQISFDMLGFAQ